MTVTYRLSFLELFRVTLWLLNRTIMAIPAYLFFTGGSLVAIAGSLWTQHPLSIGSWIGLLFGLGFMPLLTFFILALRHLRVSSRPSQTTLRFSDEAVTIESPNITSRIAWDGFIKARESPHFFFLYLAPGRAIAIPARAVLQQGTLNEFRELIAKRMGSRAGLRSVAAS